MKKIIACIIIASLLAGCGAPLDVTQADGSTKTYPTYGFFNQKTEKSDKMCYEVSVGNVVWSIILFETVIAPVYFIGFSLYNPTGPKDASGKCGIDAKNIDNQ